MPKSAVQLRKREITIIGGGIQGCITAVMLARLGWYVTIMEADHYLLNRAAISFTRLHLGGEYTDPQTMRDCAEAGCIWKLVMPPGIYTQSPGMRFLIASEAEREGRITPEQHLQLYKDNSLRTYVEIFAKTHNHFKTKNNEQGKPWSRRETGELLFGLPEKFYRTLGDEILSEFMDSDGKCSVVGGFQSREPGLNVPLYLSAIEDEIYAQQRRGQMTVLTGCRAMKNGIVRQKDGSFEIHYTNTKDGNNYSLYAPQIVQCVAEHEPELTPLQPGKSITVYNRAILIINASQCKKRILPTFRLSGPPGGMIYPWNDRLSEKNKQWVAIGYVPTNESAYWGGQAVLTHDNPSIPPVWDPAILQEIYEQKTPQSAQLEECFPNLSREVYEDRMWVYFNQLKERFPILEGAWPISLMERQTINLQDKIEKRPFEDAEEVEPGRIIAHPTKGTYAAKLAIQTATMAMHRFLRHNDPTVPPLKNKYVLENVFSGWPSLRDMKLDHNPERGRRFAAERPYGLPPNLIDQPELGKPKVVPIPSQRITVVTENQMNNLTGGKAEQISLERAKTKRNEENTGRGR